jgi:hypothetical protein
MNVRLEKIENNTKIPGYEWFFDFIDCGEYYLLIVLHNKNGRVITLNQNTFLEGLPEECEGGIYFSKLCKNTFRMCVTEDRKFYSHNIDEAMNRTKIYDYDAFIECRILKTLVNGEGLEDLNVNDRIIRWPNKKGGRGEHWYWLLKN